MTSRSHVKSKPPVIFKVVIDFAEYAELKKAKRTLEQQTKKTHDSFKINTKGDNLSENEKIKQDFEDLQNPVKTSQPMVGAGANPSIESLVQQSIEKIFEKYNISLPSTSGVNTVSSQEIKQLPAAVQIGGSDLAPVPVIDDVNNPMINVPPEPGQSHLVSDEACSGSSNNLVSLVPDHYRGKAQELLEIIHKNPHVITIEPNGTVKVLGESLNTSIVQVFPQLFQSNLKKLKTPGYVKFHQSLMGMGAGHLMPGFKHYHRKKNATVTKIPPRKFYFIGATDAADEK